MFHTNTAPLDEIRQPRNIYWQHTLDQHRLKTLISDGDVEEFVANCGAKNSGIAYTRVMMSTVIERDTVPFPHQQQDKQTSSV
jgi:hypothetical protein